MSSAHQNNDRQGQDQGSDASQSASTMSTPIDRADAERSFAHFTRLEVEAMDMDLTGLYGDPHRHVFAKYIHRTIGDLEDNSADLLVRADKALHDHEIIRNVLSETLERRRKQLEREFAMQQEAQRTGTPQPSLFGASTPEQALWMDLHDLNWIGEPADEDKDSLQESYHQLQILKRHVQTELPEVLHEVDRELKEKLILIEQIRLGYKEPWSELKNMHRTLRDSNGTMYQTLENSNAGSSKSSS